MAKKKRVELRKNRSKPPRDKDWTRGFQEHGGEDDQSVAGERVRTKGDLSRKRTIHVEDADDGPAMPAVDLSTCVPGRVLRVHGLDNVVRLDDGRTFRCKVRRLLKTLATDERSVVTAGDRVWARPAPND